MVTGSKKIKRELEEVQDDRSNKCAKHENSKSYASDGIYMGSNVIEKRNHGALSAVLEIDNKRDSPLLKLPGELRNQIYGYFHLFRTSSGEMPTSEYRRLAHVSRQLRGEVRSYTLRHGIFYIDGESHPAGFFRDLTAGKINSIRCVMVDISGFLYDYVHVWFVKIYSIVDALEPLCRESRLRQVIVRAAHDWEIFMSTTDLDAWRVLGFYSLPDRAVEVFRKMLGQDVILEEDADWYEEAEYEGDETDEETGQEETDEEETEQAEINWKIDWESDEEDVDWEPDWETEDKIEEEKEETGS